MKGRSVKHKTGFAVRIFYILESETIRRLLEPLEEPLDFLKMQLHFYLLMVKIYNFNALETEVPTL